MAPHEDIRCYGGPRGACAGYLEPRTDPARYVCTLCYRVWDPGAVAALERARYRRREKARTEKLIQATFPLEDR